MPLKRQPDAPFACVVVAIDDDRDDLRAVAAAIAIAPTAALHLVTAFDDGHEIPTDDQHPDVAFLRRAKQHAARRNVAIEPVHDTSASRGVKRQARTAGADLIVLGSSRGAPVGRTALGAVSRAILHGATCPVLIVPSGPAPIVTPRAIGLAFDGSPEATWALTLASKIAQATGGHLELVEAVDPHQLSLPRTDGTSEGGEQLVQDEDARVAACARGANVPATGHAEPGSGGLVLPDLSVRSDLLVCGSRSWGMPGRTSLGTTADRIVRDSVCPVLVVPRPATPSAGRRTPAELRFVGAKG